MIDKDDYPPILLLTMLGPPGYLSGLPNSGGVVKLWHHFFEEPNRALLRIKYGLTNFAFSSLDNKAFSMMLAKIAHSYAVANIGIDRFDPFLLDFILENTHEHWSEFIGGIPYDLPPEDLMHSISIEPHGSVVVVRIRIFANLGAPAYRVVVGCLRSLD